MCWSDRMSQHAASALSDSSGQDSHKLAVPALSQRAAPTMPHCPAAPCCAWLRATTAMRVAVWGGAARTPCGRPVSVRGGSAMVGTCLRGVRPTGMRTAGGRRTALAAHRTPSTKHVALFARRRIEAGAHRCLCDATARARCTEVGTACRAHGLAIPTLWLRFMRSLSARGRLDWCRATSPRGSCQWGAPPPEVGRERLARNAMARDCKGKHTTIAVRRKLKLVVRPAGQHMLLGRDQHGRATHAPPAAGPSTLGACVRKPAQRHRRGHKHGTRLRRRRWARRPTGCAARDQSHTHTLSRAHAHTHTHARAVQRWSCAYVTQLSRAQALPSPVEARHIAAHHNAKTASRLYTQRIQLQPHTGQFFSAMRSYAVGVGCGVPLAVRYACAPQFRAIPMCGWPATAGVGGRDSLPNRVIVCARRQQPASSRRHWLIAQQWVFP